MKVVEGHWELRVTYLKLWALTLGWEKAEGFWRLTDVRFFNTLRQKTVEKLSPEDEKL